MLLEQEGFRVAVLAQAWMPVVARTGSPSNSTVGIDVLITSPESVKTGLDMLDFPTIVFMQSGYNVY